MNLRALEPVINSCTGAHAKVMTIYQFATASLNILLTGGGGPIKRLLSFLVDRVYILTGFRLPA